MIHPSIEELRNFQTRLKMKMEVLTNNIEDVLKCEHDVFSEVQEKEHKKVAVKYNVCYIVAAVIIKDSQVLMMRESKKSCYGMWYLPAGRVERNESLKTAVKREVKEETGLDMKVLSILSIESTSSIWFRFTFVGEHIGGKLKTAAEEDKDSIEANWIPIADVMERGKVDLRHCDIIPLIRLGLSWYQKNQSFKESYLMPVPKPHSVCILRLYLAAMKDKELHIFVGKSRKRFTEKVITSGDGNLRNVADSILMKNGFNGSFNLHGVLSLEHTGLDFSVTDGFMIHCLAEATEAIDKEDLRVNWVMMSNESILRSLKHMIKEQLFVPVL